MTDLLWKTLHQDGDQQVEQYVITKSHQDNKVERSPVRSALHSVEQHHIPIFLCENLQWFQARDQNWGKSEGRSMQERQLSKSQKKVDYGWSVNAGSDIGMKTKDTKKIKERSEWKRKREKEREREKESKLALEKKIWEERDVGGWERR